MKRVSVITKARLANRSSNIFIKYTLSLLLIVTLKKVNLFLNRKRSYTYNRSS